MSWRAVEPSPFRAWIGWAPRRWPSAGRPYLDLAAARIAWPDDASSATSIPDELPEIPDVVYLPPVASSDASARRRLAERLRGAGCAVILQGGVPEASDPPGGRWDDPLADWLSTEAEALERPLAGSIALPLVVGLEDRAAALVARFAADREHRPGTLLPLAPRLEPADRRRLVEALGERMFETVFHRPAPSERLAARRVAAVGFASLPELPEVPGLVPRAARNRELAAGLGALGEVLLRSGGSESEGAELLAAARQLRETPLDVAALAREGNLDVVGWLTPASRRELDRRLAGAGEPLLAAARSRWEARAS